MKCSSASSIDFDVVPGGKYGNVGGPKGLRSQESISWQHCHSHNRDSGDLRMIKDTSRKSGMKEDHLQATIE